MHKLDDASVAKSFADLRNDFRAAKTTRFSQSMPGVNLNGSGADYHIRSEWQYIHMIERARHYERNDMVLGQAVRRLVSNVIQEGFTPDPQTGDPQLNQILKENWAEWSSDPDACHSEGEFTFHQLEKLTLRSAVRDGDIFHLLLDNGSVQPVEGHRPRSPSRTTRNVVNGVMLDNAARRTEVWISKEELNPMATIKYTDVERYQIRDSQGHRQVLQIYFPDRFSQRRGITAFAPITDVIGMHDDLQFSTLVKAQLASLLVILREQPLDTPPGSPAGPPIGGNISAKFDYEESGVRPISGIQAGLDFTAAPGQKLKGFSPNIPNPTFFEHSMLLLGFISVNLDLPLQVMLLDPMKSNFSSWRGAIDQARTRFREIQVDLINQFHRPVWSWRTRQLASSSRALRKMIGNNPNWLKNNWKRPSFAYIEPNKDAQADATQHEKYLSSFRRLSAARGRDWDEVAVEIIQDRAKLIRAAMDLEQELHDEYEDCGISWRDILSPTLGAVTSSSVSKSIMPETEDEEDNPPSDNPPPKPAPAEDDSEDEGDDE